jgi:hypothetical protein
MITNFIGNVLLTLYYSYLLQSVQYSSNKYGIFFRLTGLLSQYPFDLRQILPVATHPVMFLPF